MGGDGLVHHGDRVLDGLGGCDVGGDRVAGVVVDELEGHARTPAVEHVLGRIELPACIRGRVDEPPPCRAGLLFRLKTSHTGLTEDACQRGSGRHLQQAHRLHLLVHTDRPMIQAGGFQRATHRHGLRFDLITQLRRARLRSSGPGFEHRGRTFRLCAFAQLVERLSGYTVLDAECRHRPARRILGPLRDRKTDDWIDGFMNSHPPNLEAQVSPPRPPELSPMS